MRYKEYLFNVGSDINEWSVCFGSDLGIINPNFKRTLTEYDGEQIYELQDLKREKYSDLLATVRISPKRILITVWESFEESRYSVIVDLFSKDIIFDRKAKCNNKKFINFSMNPD